MGGRAGDPEFGAGAAPALRAAGGVWSPADDGVVGILDLGAGSGTVPPMGKRLAAILALACAPLFACGGGDDRPASYRYIQSAILEPNCATSGCHSGLSEVAQINFESVEESYEVLTGRACDDDEAEARRYVNPAQPENSQLMHLLLGADVQTPMPPDIRLPDADIDLIEAWILEGAPCN